MGQQIVEVESSVGQDITLVKRPRDMKRARDFPLSPMRSKDDGNSADRRFFLTLTAFLAEESRSNGKTFSASNGHRE